ncbi:hypothetical protein CTI12_AA285950 [Artemisia annua]|uniref:Uncharacterized protein n=1 Tax=Artemisia annua TaxID=35608 RepID=A0A2U1NA79_ARTAN|nr:hypothetical protein CTI12_AA285950 [Artemisia annua]
MAGQKLMQMITDVVRVGPYSTGGRFRSVGKRTAFLAQAFEVDLVEGIFCIETHIVFERNKATMIDSPKVHHRGGKRDLPNWWTEVSTMTRTKEVQKEQKGVSSCYTAKTGLLSGTGRALKKKQDGDKNKDNNTLCQ